MAPGAVYLDGIAAGSTNLDLTLGPMLRARRVKRALLEADKAVPYGRVVAVLDIMNRAASNNWGWSRSRRRTMDDRVGDLLAERARLGGGAAAGIAVSILLHGSIAAAVVYAA